MLTGARAAGIARDLLRDNHFVCHKTVKSLGGDGTRRICAGSLITTERGGNPPGQYARVMERIGLLDFAAIAKSKAPCFDSLEEFVEGHAEGSRTRGCGARS